MMQPRQVLMVVVPLQQALAAFPQAFGGPPGVIVLGVNLWDLARWKVGTAYTTAWFCRINASATQPIRFLAVSLCCIYCMESEKTSHDRVRYHLLPSALTSHRLAVPMAEPLMLPLPATWHRHPAADLVRDVMLGQCHPL